MSIRAAVLANPDDQVWSLLLHFLERPYILLDEVAPRKAAPVEQPFHFPAGQIDLPVWLL